ncbi:uncharacterized protein FYW47_007184 [Aplochiton taeniatus]
MTEQIKMGDGPEYTRATNWYPLRGWWQPSPLFNQDFGPPPFLETGDLCWVEGLQRRLAATSWPGYLPSPLFPPSVLGSMHQINPMLSRAKVAGQSEFRRELYKWRVFLDVSHFAPSEIILRTSGGFLEVEGKHEEKPDEHGFITRCFTRKYQLPTGIDVTKITSTLSGDGILFVEAQLPESFLSADTIIPIQVERETETEKGSKDKMEERTETHIDSSDLQPTSPEAPAAPEVPIKHTTTGAAVHGEVSPLEGHEDGGRSSSSPSELDANLAREGEELTLSEPTGEIHPSAPVHDDAIEDLPEPSGMDGQDTADTVAISQGEPPDQVQDEGEIQPASDSAEAFEEIPHPEGLELGLSLPDEGPGQDLEYMEQEYTK